MGKRIDELTEATTVAYTDLLLIEQNPSSTKVAKKISISNFRQFVSLTDYLPSDYVTDGSVDYIPQIQAAVDTITSYGFLLIPVGVFKVSSAITITKPMTISGMGEQASYIRTSSATATVFYINTTDRVTIENLTIDSSITNFRKGNTRYIS